MADPRWRSTRQSTALTRRSSPRPGHLGTTVTSIIFLALILVTVVYLAITKRDVTPATVIEAELAETPPFDHPHHGLLPEHGEAPPLLHPHQHPQPAED